MTYSTIDPAADRDLAALERRAQRRRQRYAQSSPLSHYAVLAGQATRRLPTQARQLPARYAFHGLILLVLLIAAVVTPLYRAPAPAAAPVPAGPTHPDEWLGAIAPLSLNPSHVGEAPVPDSAFAEIDALAEPAFDPSLVRARPVPATIAAELANVRNGPGTNYDKVGSLTTGEPLTLLSRAGEWFKAQKTDGTIVWLMAELLATDLVAAELLPEATDIPVPPPPKIGFVLEDKLNLRDGPSTDYVGMTKLQNGMQLDLLARYNDWFQVQTAEGQVGWVLSQYLDLQPGVSERVEVVTSIPDPNPALVGVIRERNVNLRGGPGTDYGKVGALGAATQLDLLARYDDWFKVRTPNGMIGWVSNELIEVSSYIERRVQATRDIPALPKPKVATTAPSAKARTSQPAPPPSAAAGNVVDYAMQFVGSSYVFGAAGPKAFDCSGFTMYVYKKFGLNLPHSSAGQYNTKYGTIISNPNDLAPGDLVFFVNTYKKGISHVGIYIGGGNVVQAMSPELGLGVASIRSAYWSKHYYSAIRPNK